MNFELNNPKHRTESPFRVPDGYFDTLTERVMARIPENEVKFVPKPQPRWHTAWRAYAAVAAMVAILFGTGIYLYNNESDSSQQAAPVVATTSATPSDYIEEDNFEAVADYIMADDHDFYAYLSGE